MDGCSGTSRVCNALAGSLEVVSKLSAFRQREARRHTHTHSLCVCSSCSSSFFYSLLRSNFPLQLAHGLQDLQGLHFFHSLEPRPVSKDGPRFPADSLN